MKFKILCGIPYHQTFVPSKAMWWFQVHKNSLPSRLSVAMTKLSMACCWVFKKSANLLSLNSSWLPVLPSRVLHALWKLDRCHFWDNNILFEICSFFGRFEFEWPSLNVENGSNYGTESSIKRENGDRSFQNCRATAGKNMYLHYIAYIFVFYQCIFLD